MDNVAAVFLEFVTIYSLLTWEYCRIRRPPRPEITYYCCTVYGGMCKMEIIITIEEYSAKRGLSPIWFILRKMAKQEFVYHCWQWPAVTLKWLLHMLWISHHYETFTECRNKDSVAEIDTNSIFMIWGLDPLLALYSSIVPLVRTNYK